jgi:hypothetical protein
MEFEYLERSPQDSQLDLHISIFGNTTETLVPQPFGSIGL